MKMSRCAKNNEEHAYKLSNEYIAELATECIISQPNASTRR